MAGSSGKQWNSPKLSGLEVQHLPSATKACPNTQGNRQMHQEIDLA